MSRIPVRTRCATDGSGGSFVATARSTQEDVMFGATFTTGAELPR
jgi:hypothetical protein